MTLNKLFFWRRYTTRQNSKYWAKRTYGWIEYLETWDNPHRYFISHILKQLVWISLVEIGCGSGPNLKNIVTQIGGKQLGGVDINPEAIEIASKAFKGGFFKNCSANDIMMSDKSTDIVLSDAFYIYVGPLKIKKYLREAKRIARNNLVLCEYHHKSWLKRWKMRIFSGRHAYNYEKLLPKLGFYDVQAIKMPAFEQDNDQEFRYIIIARAPKR